jgi:hypothetical protein
VVVVDGDWKLVMDTPMGARNSTLSLRTASNALSGTHSADGNTARIFDGVVSGNDVAWKVSITSPISLTLEFKGTVAGDTISGEMSVGPMGNFSFRGERT